MSTGQAPSLSVDPVFGKTTLVEPFLREQGQPDSRLGSASGFFYEHRDRLYLVTNRHVVIDESKSHYPSHLRLRLHGRTNLTQVVTEDIPLMADGLHQWIEHPQEGIDVVAVPLPAARLREVANVQAFSIADLVPEDVKLGWAQDVVVIGYPLGFHDTVFNLPIMRRATVASAYGVPFRGAPRFLIDAQLHEGTSGSPVVSTPQTMIQRGNAMVFSAAPTSFLLGVHSATLSLLMGSREADDRDEAGEHEEPLGLSAVWYARLIEEIINQQALESL